MKIIKFLLLSIAYFSCIQSIVGGRSLLMNYELFVKIHNKNDKILGAFFAPTHGPADQSVILLNPGKVSKSMMRYQDAPLFTLKFKDQEEAVDIQIRTMNNSTIVEIFKEDILWRMQQISHVSIYREKVTINVDLYVNGPDIGNIDIDLTGKETPFH